MSIVLNTPSSGSVTLAEQDTPNNVVVTIPSISGSFVTTNSDGNVGIGATLQSWSTVRKSIQLGSGGFISAGGVNFIEFGTNNYVDTSNTYRYIGSFAAANYRQFSGAHSWWTAPSGTAGNTVTLTQAMTLDASGNLGVGITSPSISDFNASASVLHGNKSDTNGFFFKSTSSNTTAVFGAGNNAAYVSTATNSPLLFQTNLTERARLDTSGNVLFGTTAVPNGTSIYGSGFTPTGNNRMELFLASNTTAAANLIRFFNPNGQVGVIVTSGTATSYSTSSDYRLKENVTPMSGALVKVAQLKPVTYTWKVDGSAGQGFIAHELQAVVPECVTGEKDAVDNEGNPQYQGIDTSFLVATLVAAIQELKSEFDDYKLTHP